MSYFLNTMNAMYGPTASTITPTDVSWCRRGGRMYFSQNPWFDGGSIPKRMRNRGRVIWPRSKMMQGDASVEGYSLFGLDISDYSQWGEFSPSMRGNSNCKYIIGVVKDELDAPINGAEIKCYLSSNNELVSTTFSGLDGSYAAPTPYAGQNHYLVGFLDTTTDKAGSSVRTLVPTNVDGT